MAYEFKRLSEVEVVETAMDTANVLIEEDGVIKRVPKSEVGGSGDVTVFYADNTYLYHDEALTNKVTKAELQSMVGKVVIYSSGRYCTPLFADFEYENSAYLSYYAEGSGSMRYANTKEYVESEPE